MFCQCCRKSIADAASKTLKSSVPTNQNHQISTIHHDSPSSFLWSVREGCFVCHKLWLSILIYDNDLGDSEANSPEAGSSNSENEDRYGQEVKIIKRRWNNKGSPIQLQMYSEDDNLHLELVTGGYGGLNLILSPVSRSKAKLYAFSESDDTGTTSTAGNPELWNRWFRTCAESHVKCRDLNDKLGLFTPERLVQIFTTDGGASFTWRIVSRAETGNIQYLTLSHCWGLSQHTCLTTKNFSDLSEFTTYSKLPQTFQDAFHIAFSLGLRFIWIDSLCIVQDDLGDWKTQASTMGLVYKNARCNIAATWANNGDDGCFITSKSNFITLESGNGQPTKYQLSLASFYYTDIIQAQLNRRGWVAQERMLARKQLSFATSQVYWECKELVASEQFPEGIPQRLQGFWSHSQATPPSGKPTLDLNTEEDLRQAWVGLVDFYCDCRLTRLSDKMIAIAGLADEMRKATDDIYLAGLWKKDLAKQLCWATDFAARRRINRFTTPIYLAPSWSWASINGPVMSDMRYFLLDMEYASCVEVLDVSVRSEHESGLHSFVSSKLVLRGLAVQAHATRVGNSISKDDPDDWILHLANTDGVANSSDSVGIKISIIWDENMASEDVNPARWPSFLEERKSALLCMFVYIHGPRIQGLLLRKLPSTTDETTYVRMGIFTDFDGCLDNMLAARLKIPSNQAFIGDLNLDRAEVADLVHTVIVV